VVDGDLNLFNWKEISYRLNKNYKLPKND